MYCWCTLSTPVTEDISHCSCAVWYSLLFILVPFSLYKCTICIYIACIYSWSLPRVCILVLLLLLFFSVFRKAAVSVSSKKSSKLRHKFQSGCLSLLVSCCFGTSGLKNGNIAGAPINTRALRSKCNQSCVCSYMHVCVYKYFISNIFIATTVLLLFLLKSQFQMMHQV